MPLHWMNGKSKITLWQKMALCCSDVPKEFSTAAFRIFRPLPFPKAFGAIGTTFKQTLCLIMIVPLFGVVDSKHVRYTT